MGITNIPMLNGEIVIGNLADAALYHLPHSAWIRHDSDGAYHVQCSLCYFERYAEIKADEQIDGTRQPLDLGASPLYAFWKVIFPDIMPGVVSGFLLSFTMSLDDFVITYFTKGPGVDTLSTKIYAEVRKGIKPEMYSLSTILFVTVLLLLLLVNVNPSPKEEKEEAKEREAMAKKGIRFRITKRVVFRRILPIAWCLSSAAAVFTTEARMLQPAAPSS